jgi:hypothetical protein
LFYSLETENKIDFQGVYFPRAIDTQSYCGIRVNSEEDIKKLDDVFNFQIGK